MNDQFSSAADAIIGENLHQPVADFVNCRGKRIRGSLIGLAYAMGGGCGTVPSVVAEAVECLHAGSLVIDDIQDDSNLRRDRPTMHRQIGVPLAINAGNWMYFRSLEMLSTAPEIADVRCDLLASMIQAAKICHEGQSLDLAARIDEVAPADWTEIATAISVQKTGILVGLGMKLGAVAAGANHRLSDVSSRLGCQIGIALQMRNDLAELIESAKPTNAWDEDAVRQDDLRNARVTWPWAWLTRQTSDHECQRLAASLTAADSNVRRHIATEILSQVQEDGEQQIQSTIGQAIRVVSEQIVDTELLTKLRSTLSPIHVAAHSNAPQETAPQGTAL